MNGPTISAPPPDGHSLIAGPKGPDQYAGAGLLESGISLYDDITNGVNKGEWNAIALAADGVSVGLDTLAMVVNPLGELVKAGIGWLMEHLDFIREPLEFVTGDPKQIEALSQTWNNIAKALSEAGQDYDVALKGIPSWTGKAAESYRRFASEFATGLDGMATYCTHLATGIAVGGMVVATTRAIIFDAIATFISDVIVKVLIAIASATFSLGSSVAILIANVTAAAVVLAGKLTKKIARLVSALEQFARRFKAFGFNGRKIADLLKTKRDSIRNAGKYLIYLKKPSRVPRLPVTPAPPPGSKGARYLTYVDTVTDTKPGEISDNLGVLAGNEALKAWKDFQEELTGQGGT